MSAPCHSTVRSTLSIEHRVRPDPPPPTPPQHPNSLLGVRTQPVTHGTETEAFKHRAIRDATMRMLPPIPKGVDSSTCRRIAPRHPRATLYFHEFIAIGSHSSDPSGL